MKRNLFYLLFIFSGYVYSQSPCVEEYFVTPTIPNSAGRVAAFPNHATPNITTIPNNANPDELYYPDLHPESQYVYNVIFKVVRNSNGERQTGDVGEAEVMNALRNMCVAFSPFKVYYKYRGVEYIDNDDLVGDRNIDDLLGDFITPYYSNHNFYIFVLDGNILSNSVDGEPLSSPGFGYI